VKWSGTSRIDWADEGVKPPIDNIWTVTDGIINDDGKLQIYFMKDDGTGKYFEYALPDELTPSEGFA